MPLYNHSQLQQELDKLQQFFIDKTKQLRVGRPRAEMFSELTVTSYGVPCPIQSVANVVIESATSVLIKPFYADKQLMQEIEKAVQEMNLGFGTAPDGEKVRVSIPPLTEERRQETVKELKSMLEEARKSVRQVRHKFIEEVDNQSGVSEDEQKRDRESIQKLIDASNSKLDDIANKKEAELTTL